MIWGPPDLGKPKMWTCTLAMAISTRDPSHPQSRGWFHPHQTCHFLKPSQLAPSSIDRSRTVEVSSPDEWYLLRPGAWEKWPVGQKFYGSISCNQSGDINKKWSCEWKMNRHCNWAFDEDLDNLGWGVYYPIPHLKKWPFDKCPMKQQRIFTSHKGGMSPTAPGWFKWLDSTVCGSLPFTSCITSFFNVFHKMVWSWSETTDFVCL